MPSVPPRRESWAEGEGRPSLPRVSAGRRGRQGRREPAPARKYARAWTLGEGWDRESRGGRVSNPAGALARGADPRASARGREACGVTFRKLLSAEAPTTLILAVLNRDQAILVSDRRVTVDGRLVDPTDDERNKAGVLVTRDARAAFAYTGLATFQTFDTERWLLETLPKCAPPDFAIEPLLTRFARQAEHDIGALSVAPKIKRLTVMIAGYSYDDGGTPRGHLWRISNFEGGPGDPARNTASAAFTVAYWRDLQNAADCFCLGAAAGSTAALKERHMEAMHALVHARRPVRGIVGKAVDVLREVARSPDSKDTISTHCTSIMLPSARGLQAQAEYHASAATATARGIAYVHAVGDQFGTLAMKMESLNQYDSGGTPLQVVPRVGRNQPCPCGRGKRYKHCHGKAHRDEVVVSLGPEAIPRADDG